MTDPFSADALSRLHRGDLIAIVGTTTRVLDDCRVPNGALIEAPSQLPSFPSGALDRPRCYPGTDLAFALVAMDALDRDMRPVLLPWFLQRLDGDRARPLPTSFYPDGTVADPNPDIAGTLLLAAATAINPRSDPARRLIERVRPAIETATTASDLVLGAERRAIFESALASGDADRTDIGAAIQWLLPAAIEHRSAASPVAIPFCRSFAAVIDAARSGKNANARLDFFAALDAADRSGHFPAALEPDDGRPSPKPYLLSHLLFLLAAGLTGELAFIPKSGYTGRRTL